VVFIHTAFTCVSSSIWNLLCTAADSLSPAGQNLETAQLQVGFIPDDHLGLGGFFAFFFNLKNKKMLFIHHNLGVYHGSVQLLVDLYLLAVGLFPKMLILNFFQHYYYLSLS